MTRKEFENLGSVYAKLGLKPLSKDDAAKFLAAVSVVNYEPKDDYYNEVVEMAKSYKDIEHVVYFHMGEYNAFPERAEAFLAKLLK